MGLANKRSPHGVPRGSRRDAVTLPCAALHQPPAPSVSPHAPRNGQTRCGAQATGRTVGARTADPGSRGDPVGRSPHGPAQLLVGHAAVPLLLAPQLGHGLGAQELKHTFSPVLPLHEALVELRVDENVSDELPQVGAPGGCKTTGVSSGLATCQHTPTNAGCCPDGESGRPGSHTAQTCSCSKTDRSLVGT